jgi:hypothetical protein
MSEGAVANEQDRPLVIVVLLTAVVVAMICGMHVMRTRREQAEVENRPEPVNAKV